MVYGTKGESERHPRSFKCSDVFSTKWNFCMIIHLQVMVEKLYEASMAGVIVDCIVRGICRIRPGVPNVR